MIDAIRLLLFPMLMAIAAASDFVTMTIPNKISLALTAGFLTLAAMMGMGLGEVGSHVGAGATVLLVAVGFFACGWIGGGDAKLAAATALWFGFDHLFAYLMDAALLGGGLTILLIYFRLIPLPSILHGHAWAERLHQKGSGVPYGIALAAAALLVYPDTLWMKGVGA